MGIEEDVGAMKGVIYTKIDLSAVGGNSIHLFNLHTQASSVNSPTRLYVESYVSRY